MACYAALSSEVTPSHLEGGTRPVRLRRLKTLKRYQKLRKLTRHTRALSKVRKAGS